MRMYADTMRRNILEIYKTAEALGILMHRESNAQRKQRLQMLWIRTGECQTHASREPTVLPCATTAWGAGFPLTSKRILDAMLLRIKKAFFPARIRV